MAKTITTEQAWKLIESTNGAIFGATTIKRTDGKKRTFNCRLARTVQKGKVGGTLKYKPGEKNLVTVFEMANTGDRTEAKEKFRMLNMEALLSVSVDGEKYEVDDA